MNTEVPLATPIINDDNAANFKYSDVFLSKKTL